MMGPQDTSLQPGGSEHGAVKPHGAAIYHIQVDRVFEAWMGIWMPLTPVEYHIETPKWIDKTVDPH